MPLYELATANCVEFMIGVDFFVSVRLQRSLEVLYNDLKKHRANLIQFRAELLKGIVKLGFKRFKILCELFCLYMFYRKVNTKKSN